MKATIDVPDELYRQVKARAALEGRAVREVTIELYERWLREFAPTAGAGPEEWLRAWLELADRVTTNAPSGPSAREVLEQDRDRLEPRQ